jgi:lysophospholipid acyltransferase (LPLAT)-like uncharacterized protein
MDRRLSGNLAPVAGFQLLVSDSRVPKSSRYNSGVNSSPTATSPAQSSPETREFTIRQRILLWLITWAVYLAIRVIGPTLRYSLSWEEGPTPADAIFEKQVIYSFWHRSVFPAAWLWRKQGIAVMVSRSFDGEYIARIIEKFGFVAVRGSSSRGGSEALRGMKKELEKGAAVAFTIDGPRGPKYVAKPGPVLLARTSSMPMAAFYVALSDAWVLKTWDEFMIPKPFSKALARASRKMLVGADADEPQMRDCHAQLQAGLERVTKFAEENVARVGSEPFPVRQH